MSTNNTTKHYSNFFITIPQHIRHNKNLSAMSRLIYGEVTVNIDEVSGVSEISKANLSQLYGVSVKTISLWIRELVENNYLKVVGNQKYKVV